MDNTIRPTTTASGDVYIIPDYNNRNHGPAQILVLPFVPHPSASTTNSSNLPPPPPHYFYTGRSATPSYHDPPPDYETLTHSCSCSTQLTSVADDYGKEFQLLHFVYCLRPFFFKKWLYFRNYTVKHILAASVKSKKYKELQIITA